MLQQKNKQTLDSWKILLMEICHAPGDNSHSDAAGCKAMISFAKRYYIVTHFLDCGK